MAENNAQELLDELKAFHTILSQNLNKGFNPHNQYNLSVNLQSFVLVYSLDGFERELISFRHSLGSSKRNYEYSQNILFTNEKSKVAVTLLINQNWDPIKACYGINFSEARHARQYVQTLEAFLANEVLALEILKFFLLVRKMKGNNVHESIILACKNSLRAIFTEFFYAKDNVNHPERDATLCTILKDYNQSLEKLATYPDVDKTLKFYNTLTRKIYKGLPLLSPPVQSAVFGVLGIIVGAAVGIALAALVTAATGGMAVVPLAFIGAFKSFTLFSSIILAGGIVGSLYGSIIGFFTNLKSQHSSAAKCHRYLKERMGGAVLLASNKLAYQIPAIVDSRFTIFAECGSCFDVEDESDTEQDNKAEENNVGSSNSSKRFLGSDMFKAPLDSNADDNSYDSDSTNKIR